MPLSKEASAATKSDQQIATTTGTLSAADGAQTNPSKQAKAPKTHEEQRYEDLEARFNALKRK